MTKIIVAREGSIAHVTLNRPDRHNALNLAMWRELASIFEGLDSEAGIRVVILGGAGKSFCAGADITEFGASRSAPEDVDAYQEAVDTCINAITAISKPTIAAVTGYCLGGGCGLATACDFRLADQTAQFGVPAAKLSIVYGIRETENLLALVGLATAKRILFKAERLDAAAAQAAGLVDEVAGEVTTLADAWATAFSSLAPLSIAGAKYLLNNLAKSGGGVDPGLAQAFMRKASLSEDYAEGKLAFAEKRAPRFKGV